MLGVVMVNASYSAGTTGVKDILPNGFATTQNRFTGGIFDRPPNFAKLAESVDCHGE